MSETAAALAFAVDLFSGNDRGDRYHTGL